MSTTVLVTGPTGKVGRRLIPLLARRNITARHASRSPLPERAGIEPVRFDWTDESTYETARKGVNAMYLAAGPVPQAAHAGYIRALLDGAAAAGVERVVLLSTYGVDQAPPENPLRQIELAVELSGVPYTILRPTAFMQNFSEGLRWDESLAEVNSQLHFDAFSSGVLGVLNGDVLDVTGRPPVSFAEFAVGAAAAWRR